MHGLLHGHHGLEELLVWPRDGEIFEQVSRLEARAFGVVGFCGKAWISEVSWLDVAMGSVVGRSAPAMGAHQIAQSAGLELPGAAKLQGLCPFFAERPGSL